MNNLHLIAEKIKYLCEKNNISINDMLKKSNAGVRTYHNILSGSKPSIDKIIKIADYFNCSVDYLLGRSLIPEINKFDNEEEIIKIPLSYLKVSAGTGYYLSDDYDDNLEQELIDVDADKYPLARKANFAIKVKGDSMEPNFHDGDVLLIRSQPALDNGDIGIFNLNGEGYVKKFYEDHNGIKTFVSINENYPPIILGPNDEVTVFGRVLCAL